MKPIDTNYGAPQAWEAAPFEGRAGQEFPLKGALQRLTSDENMRLVMEMHIGRWLAANPVAASMSAGWP